jgi:hypothetical protein
MPWVRLDEGFPEHPKVVAAGGDAAWLHVCALAYCNRMETDGIIPDGMIGRLCDRKRPLQLARRLVDVGLWHAVNGGYEIHDYLCYQPTRVEIAAERAAKHEARASAGRLGGIASGIARRNHNGSKREANTEANTEAK